MSMRLRLALAATFVTGMIGAASAFPLQAIDPLSGAFSGTSPSGTNGLPLPLPSLPTPTTGYLVAVDATTDYYGFVIPTIGTTRISASVQSDVSSGVIIDSFMLYDANAAGVVTGLDTSATYGTPADPNHYQNLLPIVLAPGNYYLGVVASGTNQALTPAGYSGTLTRLTTVPLPAAAPMFGAAVMALGIAGYGVKRKKAATAA